MTAPVALKIEASIWAFHDDALPQVEALRQRPCVVAKRLDGEHQMSVVLPSGADCEGMGGFRVVEVDECKLAGFMSRPRRVELNADIQHLLIVMQM